MNNIFKNIEVSSRTSLSMKQFLRFKTFQAMEETTNQSCS